MIQNVISFISNHWVEVGTGFLLFHKTLVSIRDAMDKTPDTADNWFESFVEVSSKVAAYFVKGKRPLTPTEEVIKAEEKLGG